MIIEFLFEHLCLALKRCVCVCEHSLLWSCVWGCKWTSMFVWLTYVCMCRTDVSFRYHPQVLSILFFEIGSLIALGLANLTRLVGQWEPGVPPVATSLLLGLQVHAILSRLPYPPNHLFIYSLCMCVCVKIPFAKICFKALENLPQSISPKETMKYLTFLRALCIIMRNFKLPKFEVIIVNWLKKKLQCLNAHSESLPFNI